MTNSKTFWALSAIGLLILLWGVWSAYGAWEESRKVRSRLDVIAQDQRGLRQQIANVLGMLRSAGFKRGPANDWSDDTTKTQVMDKNPAQRWWRKR